MYDFDEMARMVNNYAPPPPFLFGTVCAADAEKRLMKVILEPYGTETGWCKICKGAFTDKIATEVLVAGVGNIHQKYIVMGIVNSGDTDNTSDNGQPSTDYYEDHILHSSFNGEPLIYTAYWTGGVWRVYTIDNPVMLTGAIVVLTFESGELAFCAVVDYEEVQKEYGNFVVDISTDNEIYYISTARGSGGDSNTESTGAMEFASNIRIQAIKDLVESRSLMKTTTFFDEYIASLDELLNDIRATTITREFAFKLALLVLPLVFLEKIRLFMSCRIYDISFTC